LLAGTDMEAASIIFFRIVNADARNKILEKLFHHKYRERFNAFRASFFRQLRPIDNERNEIVHWNVVNQVGSEPDGKVISKVFLTPPTYWAAHMDSPKKETAALLAFSMKVEFYSRLGGMFFAIVGENMQHPIPQELLDEWMPIFEQTVVYPPPLGHPLAGLVTDGLAPISSFQVG
jgi:hypothetical protein